MKLSSLLDHLELVKAVADALSKKDKPPLRKDDATPHSTSGGELLAEISAQEFDNN